MSPAKRVERAIAELEAAMAQVREQRWHPQVLSHGTAAEMQLRAMAQAFERGLQRVGE